MLTVSTLWPQAVQKRDKKSNVVNQAMNHDHQCCHLFAAKARSFPSARDIFATISQSGNKWNPAGHAVQALLAAHCAAVIETFISPPVVREGMSINGAHSHHWNFGGTTAALGSFPLWGQVRFAKVRAGWKLNQKHYFSVWKNKWADRLFLSLINRWVNPRNYMSIIYVINQ